MSGKKLLTEAEVEKVYGLKRSTLQDWRYKGIGPPWIKPEGRIFYRVADIEKWLDGGKQKTKGSEGSGRSIG